MSAGRNSISALAEPLPRDLHLPELVHRTVLGGWHQLERRHGHPAGLRTRCRASGPAEPPRPCSAARRARPGRPAATGRGVRSRDRHPARRQRPDHGTGPSGPHRPATANCARRVVSIGRSAVETPLPAPDAATGTPAPTTGPPSRLTSAEGQPGISRPHQGRKLARRSCPDPHHRSLRARWHRASWPNRCPHTAVCRHPDRPGARMIMMPYGWPRPIAAAHRPRRLLALHRAG